MAATADDVVTLQLDENNSVVIHLYGATIISWKCGGNEQLFVSKKSLFDNKKAIRGGIPLVFPNFGPWAAGPQHGFARINRWTQVTEQIKTSDGVTGSFSLEDTDTSRAMWNHSFRLLYTVELQPKNLHIKLDVTNKGNEAFSFTWLVHTYFRLPDISDCVISGLKGLSYIDKVKGGKNLEIRDQIKINENVDSVYISSPDEHIISKGDAAGSIKLTKSNFPDTVVWNPWKDKAATMSDFGDDEYVNMVCVEAGHVAEPKVLQAGESFQSTQTLTVSKL